MSRHRCPRTNEWIDDGPATESIPQIAYWRASLEKDDEEREEDLAAHKVVPAISRHGSYLFPIVLKRAP